jgi:hypothetical protein
LAKRRSQSDAPKQDAGAENCSGIFIFDAKKPGARQAGFPKKLAMRWETFSWKAANG